jgi:hypothetical protein
MEAVSMGTKFYALTKKCKPIQTVYEHASYYKNLIRQSYKYYFRDREKVLLHDFKLRLGRPLNLANPRTFNEKINWLMLNWRDDLATLCSDKYEVRKVVRERYGDSILNTLYGAWDRPEDIDFDQLPDQFILKVNNGCGQHIFCNDKAKLDRKEVNRILGKGLREKYNIHGYEWCYEHIKPKIICEKLLFQDNTVPIDYKFFCNFGEPRFMFVGSERATATKFDFFDLDFNHYPVRHNYDNSPKPLERPKGFEKMIEIARVLSQGFPFVRIDLYDIDGQILFGEYTFFHNAGRVKFEPEAFDEIFGDMIDISDLVTAKGHA